MKTKVYMMIGCPGAGKTTWVKENLGDSFPIVSRDIIRERLGYCKPGEKYLGSAEEENKVTSEENDLISKLLRGGHSFALDDTNLNPKYRPETIANLRKQGGWVIGVRVNTSLNTCYKRRQGQIPPAVIRALWGKVEAVSPIEFDEFIEVQGE